MDGQRNVEMRFTMREAMVIHVALRAMQEEAEKMAWYTGKHGDTIGAAKRQRKADEREASPIAS
jgi:hypothetical protein